MICPVCSQEGQPVTCTAGNETRSIVYHPQKRVHTVCNVVETDTPQCVVEEAQALLKFEV